LRRSKLSRDIKHYKTAVVDQFDNFGKRKVPHPYSRPKRATTARSGAPARALCPFTRKTGARLGT